MVDEVGMHRPSHQAPWVGAGAHVVCNSKGELFARGTVVGAGAHVVSLAGHLCQGSGPGSAYELLPVVMPLRRGRLIITAPFANEGDLVTSGSGLVARNESRDPGGASPMDPN